MLKKIYLLITIILLLIPITPIANPVKAQEGHPVSHASIFIVDSSGREIYATTDANGMATALVKPSSHTINVSAFGNKPTSLKDVDFGQTTVVNINLEPSPIIKGVVTVDGEPTSGVLLNVGGYWVYSDSQGRYYAPVSADIGDNVSVSAYSLGDKYMLMHYGKLFDVMKRFMGALMPAELPIPTGINLMLPHEMKNVVQKTVSVTLNSMETTLNIDLESSFSITGSVMAGSNPVSGAIVMANLNDPNNPLMAYGMTDENGHYTINYNVKAGSYNLTVYAIGYSMAKKSIQVSGDTSVDFQLETSPTLSGAVLSQDNHPISHAYVFLKKEGSNEMLFAVTDDDGNFYLDSGLSVGTWTAMYGYTYGMMPIMSNKTIEIHEGDNNVQLILPVTTMKFEGVLDDPARDHLLEPVSLTISAQVFMYNIPFTFTIGNEGHFEYYVPKSFNMSGQIVQASSYSVSVEGNYYYPKSTIASNIVPSDSYNLGTVEVDAGQLVNVTFHVTSMAGNIEAPDLMYHFDVYIDDASYNITISTNSTIEMPMFLLNKSSGTGTIYLMLGGQGGTVGVSTINIPKSLMQPPFTVYIDGESAEGVNIQDMGSYTQLTLSYGHSIHYVSVESSNVVPDFTAGLVSVIILISLIALFLLRRH